LDTLKRDELTFDSFIVHKEPCLQLLRVRCNKKEEEVTSGPWKNTRGCIWIFLRRDELTFKSFSIHSGDELRTQPGEWDQRRSKARTWRTH
jgi:hypothetical protein